MRNEVPTDEYPRLADKAVVTRSRTLYALVLAELVFAAYLTAAHAAATPLDFVSNPNANCMTDGLDELIFQVGQWAWWAGDIAIIACALATFLTGSRSYKVTLVLTALGAIIAVPYLGFPLGVKLIIAAMIPAILIACRVLIRRTVGGI